MVDLTTDDITFLYQDEHIFAVEKPARIHSVAQDRSDEQSIADLLLQLNPDLKIAAPKEGDAGLINRLDRETSGILLGAYSPEAWNKFAETLKSNLMRKSYVVLLEGKFLGAETVRGWIGSPYRRAKKVRVYRSEPPKSARALPAESSIRSLQYDEEHDVTAAEVVCESARRHQLRAHCSSIDHPLLGDTLYGSTRALRHLFPDASQRSFFLHAARADFVHPFTNKPIAIISKPEPFFATRFGR